MSLASPSSRLGGAVFATALLALLTALPAGAGSKSLPATSPDTHSRSGSPAIALTATAPSVSGGVFHSLALVTSPPGTLTSIEVTPANPSIPNGTDLQFTATATFSDGTTADVTSSVSWTSSAPTVATVDSTGLAHGASPGTSTITATEGASGGPAPDAGPGTHQTDATLGAVSGETLLTVDSPTAVTLASFSAHSVHRGFELRWRTASERHLLGFNVYAVQSGKLVKLNRVLIPSLFGGAATGHKYSFLNRSARRGVKYTYRLQAVSLGGTRAWLGTAVARR